MNNKGFFKGMISGGVLALLICLLLSSKGIFFYKVDENTSRIIKKTEYISDIIDRKFYFGATSEEIEDGIYKGMMSALGDIYATYMPLKAAQSFTRTNEGVYCGIGVEVLQKIDSKECVFDNIRSDSPAEAANFHAGDILIKVDGVDVRDILLEDIIADHVLGEEGTNVEITVYRPSEKREITEILTRSIIVNELVFGKMLEDKTGYIRIKGFDLESANGFVAVVDSLVEQGMEKVIYDVRSNPGGDLSVVLKMLDYILPEGKLLYTVDKNGVTTNEYVSTSEHDLNLPAVVLINENSASASEVFASAVRDFERGKLVGEKSFGKGIVQEIYNLPDGSMIKFTAYSYYTKNGYQIHGNGLIPDVIVKDNEPFTAALKIVKPDSDVQLMEAMRILNGENK